MPPMTHTLAPAETAVELALWRTFTRQALQAQRMGLLDQAFAGHIQALQIARDMLEGPLLQRSTDDCLAAAVCSHHNLADVHQRRGETWQAVQHVCWAHHWLLDLAGDSLQPPAVRHATWRHLDVTRTELLLWLHELGPQPEIEAALAAPLPGSAASLLH